MLENYTKSAIVKLKLLEIFFFGVENQFYQLQWIANELDVNINTVKSVFSELKSKGYFVAVKGKGFCINKEFLYKRKNLLLYQGELSKVINKIINSGLNSDEVFFCFNHALLEQDSGDIYYVDEEYYNLFVGRRELEEQLQREVIPLLLPDAVNRLKECSFDNCIIITTYYCLKRLEEVNNCNAKIFPLKITPPIDTLINFDKVSTSDIILVITINDEMKRRFERSYSSLMRKFNALIFVSIEEKTKIQNLIKDAKYVLTLKQIYDTNKNLFNKVKNLVVYSRFHDEEGIKMLKDVIESRRF
ncbi:hypothetical protein DEFDS_0767 [Deferribacter desulfuricans SSM1]|uniref:Uncharacterized protein n=1 Tax=Deferribacter desulfuricans (strain DSM 14783 / JCM 11476 / NBRC 101012 / SSM1) TaxID=639282 RepID=D3PCC2_DEFDS|nr:hypothetical protein [Deferribacter desulfuricans]BAI80245.1 hypothetical protein DEFDS_0767 [Deferribacter desulfuricans SSM1]